MKIVIIGYGFVGKALEAGLNEDVDLIKIDPKLDTKIKDLKSFKPDAIFICVPTPMSIDYSQDISILKNVLQELNDLALDYVVVLKSTVLPDHVLEIQKNFPNFIYNPEFLREEHAIDDFISSDLIVHGGNRELSEFIAKIYKDHSKRICTDYIFTDAVSASLIKYTINSFLATKVIIFNELHSLFNKSGISKDWAKFTNAISSDKRVGSTHMQVPGHDRRFSFGGACLPKDSKAFSILC